MELEILLAHNYDSTALPILKTSVYSIAYNTLNKFTS